MLLIFFITRSRPTACTHLKTLLMRSSVSVWLSGLACSRSSLRCSPEENLLATWLSRAPACFQVRSDQFLPLGGSIGLLILNFGLVFFGLHEIFGVLAESSESAMMSGRSTLWAATLGTMSGSVTTRPSHFGASRSIWSPGCSTCPTVCVEVTTLSSVFRGVLASSTNCLRVATFWLSWTSQPASWLSWLSTS